MYNIVEYLRERVINELFEMNSFNDPWDIWNNIIKSNLPVMNATNVLSIGDKLSSIFHTTGTDRSQSQVSIGGNAWEALVCYYMNLCLIGTNTVVIKQKKTLVPEPFMEALAVKYDTFKSNTESNLIAITFPETSSYTCPIKDIYVNDTSGHRIENFQNGKFNYLNLINALIEFDFDKCQLLVIQCKTNWNDNAQIPMLWDMLYSSDGFYRRGISIGSSEYNIRDLKLFGYAFVTIPTNKSAKYTPQSTPVKRVKNISGGNFWGKDSENGVALSIKEIYNRNNLGKSNMSFKSRLNNELNKLVDKYTYFRLE
ncbi:hypothetical protein [Acetoanaerobium noterae]|uniref:hypothetical protein n=1 Tax=Acetoanaerobium noterae TaxID=745369 RepID=UPI003341D43B